MEKTPDYLIELQDALNDAQRAVSNELLSCPNWINEDKEQWQRTRVQVVRRLMLALSAYL